jgi:hypothetical protein
MDLLVIESNGNGGDLVKKPKDLAVIEGLQTMPYLALFGGNVEASTGKRLATEQAFDYWGNTVFAPNDQKLQMNSQTERALINTPLTSAGRAIIENAVKQDLIFMKDFCKVAVAVTIPNVDKVLIGIRLQEPDNIQNRDFIYIWDATKKELLLESSPGGSGVPDTTNQFFNYTLDFEFI